jgi:hypothetical protein
MMNFDMFCASIKGWVFQYIYIYIILSVIIYNKWFDLRWLIIVSNNDESHITCFVALKVVVYSTSIDDMTIHGCFLLLQSIPPLPHEKT